MAKTNTSLTVEKSNLNRLLAPQSIVKKLKRYKSLENAANKSYNPL